MSLIKDELVFRLRGPHVNPLKMTDVEEISRLQVLCREAADEIERLRRQDGELTK